ncbi:MAG: NADH-quinone oxidoreductase subunit NuoK [Verrucomicrobiota bacterium]
MTEITLNHYLAVSALLFSLGLAGIIFRRNLIVIYMCMEMMLNAANLSLIAFSRFMPLGAAGHLDGQIMVFFVITVAAAEVAVGLALIVALYRQRQTTRVEDLTLLKF